MRLSPLPRRFVGAALLVAHLAVAACSDGESATDGGRDDEGTPVELPASIEIFEPADPITTLDVVEDMSEEVANRFLGLADLVRKRSLADGGEWFTRDFAGEALNTLPVTRIEALPLDVAKAVHDVSVATVVGRDGWLGDLTELLQPFGAIEHALFKVKGAEFEPGAKPRGRITFKLSVQGRDGDGAARSIVVWAHAEVLAQRGRWALHRWKNDSLDVTTRATPMFTDVSVPTGTANQVGLFGKDGNDKFYWNGAAVGDVDGDGLWDLFVPSTKQAFLYRNRGDGKFEDVASAWGLAGDQMGTGCVFFDYDNDGDSDLVVGHVGWVRRDGRQGGDGMRLYRNDGGRFTDVSEVSGLSGLHASFSVVAADFDGNGYTDVYVCSYNRMDAVYPESWHHAENGTANALYMNQGDGTFVDEAEARGAHDSRWTFAAAAADFDQDGDIDLYLANDYGDNALLVNRGDGHFTDRAGDEGVLDTGNGMGVAWGDVDNDADLDLYVANMSSTAGTRILRRMVSPDDEGLGGTLFKLASGNSIFRWDDGGFDRQPAEAGGVGASWAWSSNVLDIDLDGNQDVMVANGFLSGESAADT